MVILKPTATLESVNFRTGRYSALAGGDAEERPLVELRSVIGECAGKLVPKEQPAQ